MTSDKKLSKKAWLRVALLVTCHLSLVTLSACGFEPMAAHGPEAVRKGVDEPTAMRLASVQIDPVADRVGQKYRMDLEDRLNPGKLISAKPEFQLTTQLVSSTASTAVSRDGTTLRYNTILDAVIILTRISDGTQVFRDKVRQVGSYNNVPNAYFSSFVAEQSTATGLATELAEEVRVRLAGFFAHYKPESQKPAAKP